MKKPTAFWVNGCSMDTLLRRIAYGGRKGRSAAKRLRRRERVLRALNRILLPAFHEVLFPDIHYR